MFCINLQDEHYSEIYIWGYGLGNESNRWHLARLQVVFNGVLVRNNWASVLAKVRDQQISKYKIVHLNSKHQICWSNAQGIYQPRRADEKTALNSKVTLQPLFLNFTLQQYAWLHPCIQTRRYTSKVHMEPKAMIISKRNLSQGAMFRFQFHVKRWEGNWLVLQTSTLPDHSGRIFRAVAVQLSSFRVISLTQADPLLVKEKAVTFENYEPCFV